MDAFDSGSGVSSISFNIDFKGYLQYSGPLRFNEPGTHTLVYRSTDNVGNLEEVNTISIIVDNKPPVTRAAAGDLISNADIVVKLNATDSESGVVGTFFRVVREKEQAGDFRAGNEAIVRAQEDHTADGNYTIEYFSVDRLNNSESVKELKVSIDTQVFLQLGFNGTPAVKVNRFTIEGRTEQGARVTINGEKAELRSDGSFSYDVWLEPGRNKAVIVVTDSAGNTLDKTVTINYERPVKGVGWLPAAVLLIVAASAALAGIFLYMNKGKRTGEKARPPRRASQKAGHGSRQPPARR
jgi:hypothetical protein